MNLQLSPNLQLGKDLKTNKKALSIKDIHAQNLLTRSFFFLTLTAVRQ